MGWPVGGEAGRRAAGTQRDLIYTQRGPCRFYAALRGRSGKTALADPWELERMRAELRRRRLHAGITSLVMP